MRTRRRGEHRRDLALSEIPQPHPQDAGLHRRRAGPPRVVKVPSGQGGPAQAGLHRPNLDDDQHVAEMWLGPQRTKGALVDRFGHWRTLIFIAAPRHTTGLTYLGSWTNRSTATPFRSCQKHSWSRRLAAATSSSWTTSTTTNRNGARGGSRRRCPPAVPSALQPRSQPGRTGVRQAQALPARGLAANPRRSLKKRRLHSEKLGPEECANYLENSGYAVAQTK